MPLNFIASFRACAHELLSIPDDSQLNGLYLLSGLGEYGKQSQTWKQIFSSIGVVHFLVLSGSQVSHFLGALDPLSRLLSRFVRPKGVGLFRALFFVLSLCAFGLVTGWPAPLARAILVGSYKKVLPRVRLSVILALALSTQIALFPLHLAKPGFYLSWLSFFALMLCRRIPAPLFIRAALLTVFCQLAASWVFMQASPSCRDLGLAVASNVILGFAFEVWIFPLCGLALVAAFCLAPGLAFSGLDWAAGLFRLTRPFLVGGGELILVVLRGFMYIR